MTNTFSIPCCTAFLKDVRGFVRDVLNKNGFSNEQNDMIVLAIDEACANAIIHGNNCDATAQLQLEISTQNKQLTIKVMDTGDFTPNCAFLSEDLLENCVHNRQKGGLGLLLMHKIMDKVEYITHNNVNFCVLQKKLDQ